MELQSHHPEKLQTCITKIQNIVYIVSRTKAPWITHANSKIQYTYHVKSKVVYSNSTHGHGGIIKQSS